VTDVEGPSPVIMKNSPARKNQSPATVTIRGGVSWKKTKETFVACAT
jgi:hypothetical protein